MEAFSSPRSEPLAIVDGVATEDTLKLKIRQGGRVQSMTAPFDSRQVLSGLFAPTSMPAKLRVGESWPVNTLGLGSYGIQNGTATVLRTERIETEGVSQEAFVIGIKYGTYEMTVWANCEGEVLQQKFLGFTLVREKPTAEAEQRREAMIEIENVTKRFGEKVAVDHLSLTVPSGEFFAFVGPNGAGKTTTIKMIVGLLHADEGTVRICGQDIQKNAVAAKALLSHIPDQPYLYDKLTGREFLEFVARMHRIEPAQARRKIEELSDLLSLRDYLDDLAEGYSHGMKQRVVIASAIVHDPKVIVVDEPMVGLDPRSVRVVKDLLRSLSQAGATIFMSTHTLNVAEELAGRVGIIDSGRMVAVGTLDELRRVSGGAKGLEESFLRLTAGEE